MAVPALVTTARNARVSAARRLTRRAFRRTDRRFLVEGPQVVGEALAEPDALVELFVTPDAASRYADLLTRATTSGVPVVTVTDAVMGELAQTVTPQGVVGVARFRDVSLDELVATRPRLVAVLAQVRDPGNAGTILRTADAAGADAVVYTDSSVDPYNPKSTRASAGSVFHLPFATGVPVTDALTALRAAGIAVLAADPRATIDLDTVDLSGPTAWVFGNEAWGLPVDVAAQADQLVRVPMHGHAESLNLATAAAVCLYASARGQRQPGGCRT